MANIRYLIPCLDLIVNICLLVASHDSLLALSNFSRKFLGSWSIYNISEYTASKQKTSSASRQLPLNTLNHAFDISTHGDSVIVFFDIGFRKFAICLSLQFLFSLLRTLQFFGDAFADELFYLFRSSSSWRTLCLLEPVKNRRTIFVVV